MSKIIYNRTTVQSENPCISHTDRGFTLGHGLFETIFINKGATPALDYHWRRLEASAPVLGIIIPFSKDELKIMLNTLIASNNLQDKMAGARVTITHGDSERGILPIEIPAPNFLITVFECAKWSSNPFTALIANIRKNEHSPASTVKSISYLDNILARREAIEQRYDEAILLNTASNVADGSISNVYIVKGGQIFTPPVIDGALPGVIRSILLEEFNDNFPIIETSITSEQLMRSDEIFLTNALMGVKSLKLINNKILTSFVVATKIYNELKVRNYF